MAKKKAAKRSAKKTSKPAKRKSHRVDPLAFGIDMPAIVQEIKPHLDGTYAEIGQRAGGIPAGSVSNLLNGTAPPSLGSVAALAHAAGGRLIVRFEPAE
jgi:hypothetical protein